MMTQMTSTGKTKHEQKIIPTGSKLNAKGGGVARVQGTLNQLFGIYYIR